MGAVRGQEKVYLSKRQYMEFCRRQGGPKEGVNSQINSRSGVLSRFSTE